MQGPADAEGTKLSTLPASTVGAVSISGLGDILAKQWPQITKAAEGAGGQGFSDFVASAQQTYGLALPGDLVTLLGRNLTIALDEKGLDGDLPNVGAVLSTDPAKAQEVVSKIERFVADSSGTTTPQIIKAAGDGRLVLASSQEYAGTLAKDGTLGESETFTTAVPDADSATAALYVDLDKIEKYYLNGLRGDERANLQVLRAVGLSGRQSGDTASFSLRVLFN